MSSIITLTTDFGLNDTYVASMKAAILNINPALNIVDICHTIPPQNIKKAAFLLSTSCFYFPRGTIHVVVVDPGVGSERRALIVKTPQAYFIAPDNGVLTYAVGKALEEVHLITQGIDHSCATRMDIGEGIEAISITNSRYWSYPVSPTFHGRDILGPVAAHLSLGVPMEKFGETVSEICSFPIDTPRLLSDGTLLGNVINIDYFGNLTTSIKERELKSRDMVIMIGRHTIKGLSRFYAEHQGLTAIIGSSGYLEIALQGGSAQRQTGAKVGDEIKLQPVPIKTGKSKRIYKKNKSANL